MKKLWITLFVLVLGATALSAQEKSPAVLVKERISYMRANLTLSGTENQNFWKVYEEYLNAELKAMDTYRKNLEKQGIKLGAPGSNKETIARLNDKQLTYLQDQKFELRKNLLNLESTYYKKYKAILNPRTIQELYDLEYRYKKQLTKERQAAKSGEPASPVNGGKKKR